MQLYCSRKNLTKTLCKNSPKTPQKPHKNPAAKNLAKIFYDFLNKKPAKNFKIFQKLLNFTKYFKLKQKTMKKFEFICKTDLITGQTVWLTREDGLYVPSSLRLNKDDAYGIFIKLSNQEPLEMFEILETKTSPNE
jgi:hypothetical protein